MKIFFELNRYTYLGARGVMTVKMPVSNRASSTTKIVGNA
jgi:hypothetical protein